MTYTKLSYNYILQALYNTRIFTKLMSACYLLSHSENGRKKIISLLVQNLLTIIIKLNNNFVTLTITFDPKLNLNHHIYEITHKATKILGILKRTFYF